MTYIRHGYIMVGEPRLLVKMLILFNFCINIILICCLISTLIHSFITSGYISSGGYEIVQEVCNFIMIRIRKVGESAGRSPAIMVSRWRRAHAYCCGDMLETKLRYGFLTIYD